MGYPNPNRTRKDPNRTRTEIQKYPNGAEIFDPENPKSEWVPERPALPQTAATSAFEPVKPLKPETKR